MKDECPRGWTIETLKAYFELKFTGVENMITTRDKALELQAKADEIHFLNLNHEAARILKAQEVSVSRDTWDAFIEGDRKWKADIEKRLDLRTGQSQGIVMSSDLLFKIAPLVIAIATAIFVFTRG